MSVSLNSIRLTNENAVRMPQTDTLPARSQSACEHCRTASYNTIPTDVARFRLRVSGCIGMVKHRSGFALSKLSGNPRVSLPKTR
jgi:hypothetical protein